MAVYKISMKDPEPITIKGDIEIIALRDSGLQGTLYIKGDICVMESMTLNLVTIIDKHTRVVVARCWTSNFSEDWKYA